MLRFPKNAYCIIYHIPPNLDLPRYLTVDWSWSTHEYEAQVFCNEKEFHLACDWVRKQNLKPSCTEAAEKPPSNHKWN